MYKLFKRLLFLLCLTAIGFASFFVIKKLHHNRMQTRIDRSSAEKMDIESENQHIKATIAAQKRKNQKLQQQSQVLQAEIDTQKRNSEKRFVEVYQNYAKELNSQQEKNKSLTLLLDKLKAELESLKGDKKNEALLDIIANLEKELKKQKECNAHLSAIHQNSKEVFEKQQKEAKTLRTLSKNLKKEIKNVKTDNNKLLEQLHRAHAKTNHHLEEVTNALNKKTDSNNILQQEKNALESKIIALEAVKRKADILEKEVQIHQKEKEKALTYKKELTNAVIENESLRAQLEEQIEKNKTLASDNELLKNQNEQLDILKSKFKTEQKHYKKLLAEWQEAKEEVLGQKSIIQRLEEKLIEQDQSGALKTSQVQLKQANKKVENLELQLDNAVKKHNKLINKLTQKVASLAENNDEFLKISQTLKEELAAQVLANNELKKLNQKLATEHREIDTLQSAIVISETNNKVLLQKLKEAQETIITLNKKILHQDIQRKHIDTLEVKSISQKETIELLEKKLDQEKVSQAWLNKISDELNKSKYTIQTLQNKLNQRKNEAFDKQKENNELKEELRKLNKSLLLLQNDLEKEKEKTQKLLKKLSQKISSVKHLLQNS